MDQPVSVLFAHYGENWIRGSEVVLLDLLAALDKTKVRPVVWCNSPEMASASNSRGYITYRDDFHHMLDYSSPPAEFARWRKLVKRCAELCHRHQIDVLHSNGLAPTQWLAPAAIELRRPILAQLHIDYLRRSRYVLGLHAATMIVACCASVAAGAFDDGIEPERVRVIHNGIDFSRFGCRGSLREELHIPSNALVIASVASLIHRKGYDVLLSAFHGLRSKFPESHLVIGGSGEEERALREQTKSLGMSERVHFIGDTKGDPRIYEAADVFALASRNEAVPLALLEAGYFGLPCVSTTAGGIPEAIVNGHTGILVAAGQVGTFRDALIAMASDMPMRRRMGAAARARIEKNFSSVRMARDLEQAYEELAAVPKSELGWRRTLGRTAKPFFRLGQSLFVHDILQI